MVVHLLNFFISEIYFVQSRLLALVKDAASSLTLEKITEQHKGRMTHAYSSRNVVDKVITLGKVEGSVEVYILISGVYSGCSGMNFCEFLAACVLHLV